MGLEKKYIDMALGIKAVLREKAERKKAEETAKLRAEVPRIAEIDSRIASLGAEYTRVYLSGDTERIKALETEIDVLASEKQVLSDKAGKSVELCVCKLCGDTGYADGKICDCVKVLAAQKTVEELAETAPIRECTFETFDLSVYPEAAGKRMSGIYAFAKKYADDFGQGSGNILFLGNTGLGKTHLSLAIANEVIKKGYGAVYGPAQTLFGEIETEYFSYSGTDEKLKRLLNADLLIIDDLGTEFSTQFIQSVFYNIVNSRMNAGKPTVISTNLEIEELEKRYTPRILSRFIGSYEMKKFMGNDVRQIKALNKK